MNGHPFQFTRRKQSNKNKVPEDPKEKEQEVPPFLLLKISKQPTIVEVASHLFAEITLKAKFT